MRDIEKRLREQREALGLSQSAMAERCGVASRSQQNYESGERSPDGEYFAALAAAGGDVLWVITGQRDYTPPPALTAQEQTMLDYFRQASAEVRRAALGALLGASAPAGRSGTTQIFHGNIHGDNIARDKIIKGKK